MSSVHSHSSPRLHPRVCLARCARVMANVFAGGGSRRAQAAQACKSCGGVTHGDEGSSGTTEHAQALKKALAMTIQVQRCTDWFHMPSETCVAR